MKNDAAPKYEGLFVSGTIDREAYESIHRFMMSPAVKRGMIGLIAVLAVVCAVLTFVLRDPTWLVGVPLVIVLGVFWYRANAANILRNVMVNIPDIDEGRHYDLELTFSPDVIHLWNRNTNMETTMAYDLFSSYAETEPCIALFVETGTYLLVPKSNLADEKKNELYALLKQKCPKLKERKY